MDLQEQNTAPLVSVVMPAYNATEFIREAIDSVRRQTVQDWELIVVDDGSVDDTRQIVEAYARQDPRIHLVCNPENLGTAGTRNRGMDVSRGQYVALLDSDDYWQPTFLEKMLACAEKTQAEIVYCSYAIVDTQGKSLCNDFIVPESTDFQQSMIRNVISCSTVLMSRKIAGHHRFPLHIYHEDIALWFQLLRDGAVARGVPEVLAAYRQREHSKTANKIKSACRRWGIYRKHLGLPFVQSCVLLIRYAYYGIVKYKRI